MRKKSLGLWIVLTTVFLLAGCGNFGEEQTTQVLTCEEGYINIEGSCQLDVRESCDIHETYDPITNTCADTRTYVDMLREDPVTFHVNPAHHVSSYIGDAPLDYSDDKRTLWDASDYQGDSVIVFPDPIFHQMVLDELDYEDDQDITYADVLSVDYLYSRDADIRSIEGIELFVNLTHLNLTNSHHLSSIRGAHVLPELQSLVISHTGVRTIDHGPSAFPSLQNMYLDHTKIEVENHHDLFSMIDDYTDHLESLSIQGIDNIKFSDDTEVRSLDYELRIDLSQIDFETFDVRSFFVKEDHYGRDVCINRSNISIDVLPSSFNYNFSPCREEAFFLDIFEDIQSHVEKLNIDPNMDEATKVFLIYQYVFDLFKDNRQEITEYSSDDDLFTTITRGNPIMYPESSVKLLYILLTVHDIDYVKTYGGAKHSNIDPPYVSYGYNTGGISVANAPLSVRLDDGQFYYIDIAYNLFQYWEGNEELAHTFFLTGSESFTDYHQAKIDALPSDQQGDKTIIRMPAFVNASDYSFDLLFSHLPEGIVETDDDPVDVRRVFLHRDSDTEPIIAYLTDDGSLEGITLEKPHHRFLGLYTDEARTVPYDPSASITDDMHLYAKWEKITYQISFETNSDETIDPLDINFRDVTQLPALEKQDFIFTGWMLGDTPVNRMFTFDLDNDITLSASWISSTDLFGYQYSSGAEGEQFTLTSVSRDVDVLFLPDDLNVNLFSSPDGPERKMITAIGSNLFSDSSITYIRLGQYIDTIEANAFSNTTQLSFVKLPLGIKTIEAGAFSGSSAKILVDVSIDTSTFEEGWDQGVSVIYTQGDIGVYENMYYVLTEDDEIMVLGTQDPSKSSSLTIPETIQGYPVTTIADHFASGNTWLREVIIPNTITDVGEGAFKDAANLTDVSFSENSALLEISAEAFKNTNISAIALPNTLEIIGESAFDHTSIDDIIIPASVTYVGGYFMPEDISVIYFEGDIDDISKPWFETYYSAWADHFEAMTDDGIFTYVLRDDETAYLTGVKDEAHPTVLEIPSMVEGHILTTIMPRAFHDNDVLRKIIIPNTITSIGEAAFQDASLLAEIDFEEGMTLDHLGGYAFADIPHLLEIDLFPAVETIPAFAFLNSNIRLINFSEGLLTIESQAFEEARAIRAIHFPSTIQSIDSNAFEDPEKIIFTTPLDDIPGWLIDLGFVRENGSANMRSIAIPQQWAFQSMISGINNEGQHLLLRYITPNSNASTVVIERYDFDGFASYAFFGHTIGDLIITYPLSSIDPLAFHGATIERIILYFPVPDTFSDDWNHDGTNTIPYMINEPLDITYTPEEDE